MNTKTKRRMAVAAGIIVIVLIIVLAVVGGNSAAKTVSVAEAVELEGNGKIQVTGNVVESSFSIDGDTLTFSIYDAQTDPHAATQLDARYEGGVSATFGNDVTAICTGKKDGSGVLVCSELVTKCPSKYESGANALPVTDLLGYGSKIIGKTVKVEGTVKPGTLDGVDAEVRFTIADRASSAELPVRFAGALSNDIVDGAHVVLTGAMGADGAFEATNVALEG